MTPKGDNNEKGPYNNVGADISQSPNVDIVSCRRSAYDQLPGQADSDIGSSGV